MIKKLICVVLLICILLSLTGCSVLNIAKSFTEPTEMVFAIDGYDLQIKADSSFSEKTEGDFDLQITNGDCYISIMAFKRIDISDSLTPLDVFDMQNETLFGQRSAVKVIEDAKTQALPEKSITNALYSAEKDGVKNYYATYLIDFTDGEVFVWALVSAMPSYLDENKEYLHNIVCSVSTVK